jgi:hypothetical protein
LLHLFGLAVLLYYVLPAMILPWLPTEVLLLAALGLVLVLEASRLALGVELPTIRDYERARVASYTWFAVGLVVAVLLFPRAIAVAAVLGTGVVDPLIGELRLSEERRRWYPAAPALVYFGLATSAFLFVGRWHWIPAVGAAGAMAAVALAIERPKRAWLDDDFTMTMLPGIVLTVAVALAPWLPNIGP